MGICDTAYLDLSFSMRVRSSVQVDCMRILRGSLVFGMILYYFPCTTLCY